MYYLYGCLKCLAFIYQWKTKISHYVGTSCKKCKYQPLPPEVCFSCSFSPLQLPCNPQFSPEILLEGLADVALFTRQISSWSHFHIPVVLWAQQWVTFPPLFLWEGTICDALSPQHLIEYDSSFLFPYCFPLPQLSIRGIARSLGAQDGAYLQAALPPTASAVILSWSLPPPKIKLKL